MILECPHCKIMIEIIELRCRIFRCGIFKNTFTQIDPHLSETKCNKLIKNDEIYGCGKPFCINKNDIVEKCDYI